MSAALASSVSLAPPVRPATNDFAVTIASENGTGSASVNGLLLRAAFTMGVPVSGKNIFPSNIQGLPTWYQIRVNGAGLTARADASDLLMALNPVLLAQAGVPVEFHLVPGGFHGFELGVPEARVSRRARHQYMDALRRGGSGEFV